MLIPKHRYVCVHVYAHPTYAYVLTADDEQLHCAWFQASAAKWMRSALLWVITQRVVVIYGWRFGTAYRSRPFDGTDGFFPKLRLEITTTRCLNNPGERGSQFLCCNVRAYICMSTCSVINILSVFTFSLRHLPVSVDMSVLFRRFVAIYFWARINLLKPTGHVMHQQV